MKSVFWQGAGELDFAPQKEDLKTDVLIVGGGICGILCSYMLKERGVESIVCEADKICGGATGGTTAKITVQHGLIYDKLIKAYGENFARGYLEANFAAQNEYKKLSEKISCDYKEQPFSVYSVDGPEKIEREIKALERIGCKALFTKELGLPFSVSGAVMHEREAAFNPIKLLFSLAKGLSVLEDTRVIALEGTSAHTNRGRIFAKKVIIATHFPFPRWQGAYFLKLYQHRSYVIALEGAGERYGMCVDENEKGLSFRDYNGLLLLGGAGHRTGKCGGGWAELWDFAKRYYPKARQTMHFAAQDCMSLDGVPYIGRLSRRTPDVLVATGFNKWGMTSSMAAAMLLSDLVLDKKNDYEEIFSPSRSILHPSLFSNIGNSFLGLISPTVPRCTHLGCALKYNRQEHSWDCSCHGSRFDESGKIIDNPAKKEISARGKN